MNKDTRTILAVVVAIAGLFLRLLIHITVMLRDMHLRHGTEIFMEDKEKFDKTAREGRDYLDELMNEL